MICSQGTRGRRIPGIARQQRRARGPRSAGKWAFPANAVLGGHEWLLVWADGVPALSTSTSPHAGFHLNPTGGSVALVRWQGTPTVAVIMDYLDYPAVPGGLAFGSVPDGEPRQRHLLPVGTPGAANQPFVDLGSIAVTASNEAGLTFKWAAAAAGPADTAALRIRKLQVLQWERDCVEDQSQHVNTSWAHET